jgi:hypothetical protein
MITAGFGLSLYVFYPGMMTYDARYVHEAVASGTVGDWQSPVMTWLWSLIDPIAPGSASMFLLTATLYWLAFGMLAFTIARNSIWPAVALLLLAMLSPAFAFVGMIWRDVLFADTWLLAAALALAVARCGFGLRVTMQAVALGLLALGFLIRPNALLAAPILGAAILWPTRFLWKRAVILFVPMALALFALLQFVYYGALHAERQHPLQSIMIFDLGGISHFAGENQFPGVWTAQETNLIVTRCYQPTEWDIYWTQEPCEFVMQQLERDKIFGTSIISDAWIHAIAGHPNAYLEHRIAFMWNFLTRPNLTIWTVDIDDPSKLAFPDHAGLAALRSITAALEPTPLFRAGTWLLISVAVCVFAWPRRNTPSGAVAIGMCASAVVYILALFTVGVASDFRYAYWAVLASIAGVVMLPGASRASMTSA